VITRRGALGGMLAALALPGKRKEKPVGWTSQVARQVIIEGGENGDGLFSYSGSPALGNLTASVVDNEPGTDDYGNAYLGGVTSYGASPSGSGYVASNMNDGVFTNWTASTMAGPWSVQSQLPAVSSDTTQFTVTADTIKPISIAWPVSANDAADNAIYRLTVFGTGTWGDPAQTLQFFIDGFGEQLSGVIVGAAALDPAGSPFAFRISWDYQILSVSGRTSQVTVHGTITEQGTNVLQATTIPFAGFAQGTGLDYSSAGSLTAQMQWASTAGSPELVSYGSIFERLGQAP
jgi:hypothetical protein